MLITWCAMLDLQPDQTFFLHLDEPTGDLTFLFDMERGQYQGL